MPSDLLLRNTVSHDYVIWKSYGVCQWPLGNNNVHYVNETYNIQRNV